MTDKHPGGRPRKFQSVEEMAKAIDAYFDNTEPPYTVTGLASALGMTRRGLLDYEGRDEFAHTIEKAKAFVEAHVERRMLAGEGWGPGHIFSLKNNYGWRDTQHLEHTGKDGGPIEYSDKFRAVLDRLSDTEAEGGTETGAS